LKNVLSLDEPPQTAGGGEDRIKGIFRKRYQGLYKAQAVSCRKHRGIFFFKRMRYGVSSNSPTNPGGSSTPFATYALLEGYLSKADIIEGFDHQDGLG